MIRSLQGQNRVQIALSTVTLMCALAACSSSSQGQAVPKVVVADGAVSVPSESISDWKSYGDLTVLGRVTSEQSEPDSADVKRTHEGLVLRTVTVDVRKVLWVARGATAPKALQLRTLGWVVKAGKRVPTVSRGGARLDVGHNYVLTAARFADGNWSELGPSAVIPADGDKVGSGAWLGKLPGEPVAPDVQKMIDRSVADTQSTIVNAHSDPIADKYRALDPAARYQKVVQERRKSTSTR